MRIVIDMQGAQTESRFRGIGRYTLSMAQAIARNRGGHEVVLALSGLFPDTIEPIRAAFDDQLPQENIRVWYAIGPVRECEPGNEWRREAAERIREAFLASLRPDVVFVPSLFEGYGDDAVTSICAFAPQIVTIVTLHDLIPLLDPENYIKPDSDYARHYHRKIGCLKRANGWLAVSESSASEGRNSLALPAESLVVTYEGCDGEFRRLQITASEKQKIFERFGISKPFLFYSGGADSRKNLHRLIRAYAGLPRSLQSSYQLLLAGKLHIAQVAELMQTAKTAGLRESQLIFSGYVTDRELVRLYNLCAVFILPSLHEGFGLPALEAMACGAAVIGSNRTSVPEVIGRRDALFDPYDEGAIAEKIAEVLTRDDFRSELARHGLEQANKFSWDVSASRAIGAFEKLCPGRAGNRKTGKPENQVPDLINAISAVVPYDIPDVEILDIAHALSRNHAENAHRQLLVDISELVFHDAGTGIQRVTRNILKELLESPPEGYAVEPVYATTQTRGYRYARNFTSRFRGKPGDMMDDPIEYHSGDIFLGLDLQDLVVMAQKDYLTEMRRDGGKVVFVVHDLLPLTLPDYFFPGTAARHKEWLLTLAGFDAVVCVSRTVANELKEWLAENGPKQARELRVAWSHNGAAVENSVPTSELPADAGHLLKELAQRPVFLTVGTIEPRKGQAQALDSFEILWKEGIDVNFVVIGKQGWMVEKLVKKIRSHAELGRRLFWLEGISDEYLGKIYASSTCLVAASEGEGFGLPLIEAARHKLPIIARDIPVFREVAGCHAFYFKGLEPQALAGAVRHWLELNKQGKAPRSDNMPWLTWKQSAERLKQIIIEGDRDKKVQGEKF